MRSHKGAFRLSLIVLSTLTAITGSANAGPPDQALDAYIKAYTQMGKYASLVFNNQKTQAEAGTNFLATQVSAYCKLVQARSNWITTMAKANATSAETLGTLETVRGQVMDNDLKTARIFYDRRKMYEGYCQQNVRKRPTKQDLLRYSKVSLPQRPDDSLVDPIRGKILWPEIFQREEFSDGRIELECLFAQRKTVHSTAGVDISHQVQVVAAKMREQLRRKVRQVSPSEYLAARRFLDSLAHEARSPARIDGVASN